MSLINYEPFSAARFFQDDVNRLFDRSLLRGPFVGAERNDRWLPAVDIKEADDKYVLTADVPGVDAKDIEVTLHEGVLTIQGERKQEKSEEKAGYSHTERVYGSFLRRFTLPETANVEGVSASGKDGVLIVVIPKQAKVEPRRISVN